MLAPTTPFSQSHLHAQNHRFYSHHYRDQGQLYFYTNSSIFAYTIADLVLLISAQYPTRNLTIIELGCGHGLFSFHTIQHLQQAWPPGLQGNYFLTDLYPPDHQDWDQLSNDQLRCQAVKLDLMSSTDQQAILDAIDPDDLVVVIGNYLMDSLPCDFFSQAHGILYAEEVLSNPQTHTLSHPYFLRKKITTPYYREPCLNHILNHATTRGQNGWFSLTPSLFLFLERLRTVSPHTLCLFTDKASEHSVTDFTISDQLIHEQHCLSVLANFQSLSDWTHESQGQYGCIQHQSIATAITSHIPHPQSLQALLSLSALNHYNSFLCALKLCQRQPSLNEHFRLCQASLWDPYVFHLIQNITLPADTHSTYALYAPYFHRLEQQFYFIPSSINVFLDIGHFCLRCQQHDPARHYFQQATPYLTDNTHIESLMQACDAA